MTDTPGRLTWRAERDGIAHAHVGRLPRTLCDRPATPERHAWPRTAYCPICIRNAPQPEEVKRRHR